MYIDAHIDLVCMCVNITLHCFVVRRMVKKLALYKLVMMKSSAMKKMGCRDCKTKTAGSHKNISLHVFHAADMDVFVKE